MGVVVAEFYVDVNYNSRMYHVHMKLNEDTVIMDLKGFMHPKDAEARLKEIQAAWDKYIEDRMPKQEAH